MCSWLKVKYCLCLARHWFWLSGDLCDIKKRDQSATLCLWELINLVSYSFLLIMEEIMPLWKDILKCSVLQTVLFTQMCVRLGKPLTHSTFYSNLDQNILRDIILLLLSTSAVGPLLWFVVIHPAFWLASFSCGRSHMDTLNSSLIELLAKSYAFFIESFHLDTVDW